ncbi:hypothetical protein EHF33_13735 [Deinococcus psychrotolerans]|uniref:Uncharacterized protein n=1 Tax=Deinococcus psychrotolerans TaxID=2489213 RepID=A0A3G8YGA5_9DEIO|nr:hypothetical protein [Deinococcus psychrotolerans]AZI43985.1 hypothetical protein EHF33_13735 [Deinococcus psychrotolerans]
MSDLASALKGLQRTRQEELPEPKPTASRGVQGRDEIKSLAGRVPVALHRELSRALLDVADELNVRRVNIDEALEAAMRAVIRDPAARSAWIQQLRAVREERH